MDVCKLKASLVCIQQVPGQPGEHSEALSQRERQKKMAGRERGKGGALSDHTQRSPPISHSVQVHYIVSSYVLLAWIGVQEYSMMG